MRKMIIFGLALALISACKQPDAPPKYKFESAKMDIPWTDWLEDRESAEKKANKEVRYFATEACQTKGYGWSLDKIENPGELNCEESDEGFRCRTIGVGYVCRQLDER